MKIVFHFVVAMMLHASSGFAQQMPRFEILDLQTEFRHFKRIFHACEIDWAPKRDCVWQDSLGRGCIHWVPSETGDHRHQMVVFTTKHIENGICQHDLNARHAWQCYQTYPCGHTPIEHAYTHCSWLSVDPGALPLQTHKDVDDKLLLTKESIHPTQIHNLKYEP